MVIFTIVELFNATNQTLPATVREQYAVNHYTIVELAYRHNIFI